MKGRFFITAKEGYKVTEVGCRVKVLKLILESTLKAGMARNVSNEEKVEVIVEGEGGIEELEKFRKEVEQLELPDTPKNPGFIVTKIETGDEIQKIHLPEINRISNSLTLEQLDKAVSAFLDMKMDMKMHFPKAIATELGKVLEEKALRKN